jgi:capsular polysaccharide biosynthesis protein
LAEFTEPLRAASGAAPGVRLYITRENARRRRVTNEAELWRFLEVAGFTKVRAEEWSWREQIAAFARAKVIVAPHGAGLANVAFCQPGTRVVELYHRAYVNPCFARLAEIKGLDHRPVIASGDGEPGCDPARGRCDILADLDAVRRALR